MRYAAILLLLSTPAFAVDAPSEDIKRDALVQAYEANGNSMVGWGIDLSTRSVKTDKIPVINATEKNKLDAEADDECERHGKKKVYRRKSWRCSR